MKIIKLNPIETNSCKVCKPMGSTLNPNWHCAPAAVDDVVAVVVGAAAAVADVAAGVHRPLVGVALMLRLVGCRVPCDVRCVVCVV